MIELRLLDGTSLDLRGDETIALTIAVNDIASIETRQGVTSNEFNLPSTDFNLKALGYPTNFNVNQNINPFTKINAEIYEDELRIAKGYIQITNPSISNSVLPVVFFGENSEWFNLVSGKSIRELNLSKFNHVFQASNIVDSFTNTEGYKYTLIDRNGLNFLTSNTLSSQCFTINTFQSSIVKAIIEDAGFKIGGSLLNDPLYKKILVADTNNKFYALNIDSGIVRDAYLSVKANTNYLAVDGEQTLDITSAFGNGGTALNKTGSNYNIDTDTYTADSALLANIRCNFTVALFDTTTSTGVTIRLKQNGSTFSTISGTVTAANNLSVNFDQRRTFDNGDTFTITIEPETQNITTSLSGFSIDQNKVINFVEFNVENIAIEGSVINLNATLPDVDQAEFLKDVVFDQNVLVTANLNTRTINFDLKNYNVGNFIDWSNIIDLSQPVEINYTELINNYAKINDVRRLEDDGAFVKRYNSENRIKFGDGVFTLDNDFIERRSTLFESKFAGTRTINSLNRNQPLPYIYGEDISDAININEFTSNEIRVGLDNNIEDFIVDTPDNSIWALVTDSDNSNYNRAYSIEEISLNVINERYDIIVNSTFATNATGVLRLIKRNEEAEPRKLIDGGNFDFADINQTFTSYDITSTLLSGGGSATITNIPYVYFWNPSLGLPTDQLIDSLSYGSININSRCSNLLDDYYTQTIDLLQRGKVLKASFRLNQIDIFNLDFNKLIYVNFYINGQIIQGYFILNKIEEYTGQEDSTVVELIKY